VAKDGLATELKLFLCGEVRRLWYMWSREPRYPLLVRLERRYLLVVRAEEKDEMGGVAVHSLRLR
jgi:hypothetical protein